jgi:CHAD domain-containing protein
MSAMELKSDLHKMLDQIENEQLLLTIYDFLKERTTASEGAMWKSLTEEQKKEVQLSYEESLLEEPLIAWEELKKKHPWKSS